MTQKPKRWGFAVRLRVKLSWQGEMFFFSSVSFLVNDFEDVSLNLGAGG